MQSALNKAVASPVLFFFFNLYVFLNSHHAAAGAVGGVLPFLPASHAALNPPGVDVPKGQLCSKAAPRT